MYHDAESDSFCESELLSIKYRVSSPLTQTQTPFVNTLGWVPCSGPPPLDISGHIVALSSSITQLNNCSIEEANNIVKVLVFSVLKILIFFTSF